MNSSLSTKERTDTLRSSSKSQHINPKAKNVSLIAESKKDAKKRKEKEEWYKREMKEESCRYLDGRSACKSGPQNPKRIEDGRKKEGKRKCTGMCEIMRVRFRLQGSDSKS